ncbi:MAG: aminotransferase class V-fold PLP-dependent enzyme [Prolixibacteraceae bacterium]|nr:aminotransferase class V-fold PLP-dependent enzyme [Prolixibacteraceae bacterium]
MNSKTTELTVEIARPNKAETPTAFTELEKSVFSALETYSNVHRGSGHFSMVTTRLFEQAREIVLEDMGLKKANYMVIFFTARGANEFIKQISPESYQSISSREIGLSLGVTALAVKRNKLPNGAPLQAGGGTARLISKNWVVWAKNPDKFEAGTPAIINIIAFAKALRMIQQSGKDAFLKTITEKLTAAEIVYHDELEQFSGRELLEELRKKLIGGGVQVHTMIGIRPFINLDNSASTPTFTPIWNAFRQTLKQSEQVKQEIVQEVKSVCSKTLGAPLADYEVIFTSNTTEAINLAAESLSRESDETTEPVVLGTLLEHSSNDLPWRMVSNGSIIRLSVDPEGFINQSELETLLIDYNRKSEHGKKRIKLVAISGASNVLGICNNLEEISRIVHQYGARLLVDAAQLVAHRTIDMEGSGIDYLAFSAHKVYAPFGSGALVVRKGLLKFNPEELVQIQASGEENVAGIAALGKALVLLQRIGRNVIGEEEQILTQRALRGLAKIKGLNVYGINDPESSQISRKLGVIPFAFTKKISTKTGKELAFYGGIGVRTGCHCAHITVKHILGVGPGLEKFQKLIVTLFPKLSLPGVARISFGIENTVNDVDHLIQVLEKIAENSKSTSKKEVKQQMDDFVRAVAARVYH